MSDSYSTPFRESYNEVECPYDTATARNIRTLCSSHPLYKRLIEIRKEALRIVADLSLQGYSVFWNQPNQSSHNHGHLEPSTLQIPGRWPETPPDILGASEAPVKNTEEFLQNIADLNEKLEKANQETKEMLTQLEAANNMIEQQKTQIMNDKSTMFNLRLKSAKAFFAAENYEAAAAAYNKLSDLKEKEMCELLESNDESGRHKAEENYLKYKMKEGAALMKLQRYADAEQVSRQAYDGLVKLNGDRELKFKKTRNACEQLCAALRLQGEQSKLREAATIHFYAAELKQLGENETINNWRLQNKVHLAHVYILLERYKDAISSLSDVCASKNAISLSAFAEIEAQMSEFISLLEKQKQSQHVRDLLELLCKDRGDDLSDEMLGLVVKLGLLLFKLGEYQQAIAYLTESRKSGNRLDSETSKAVSWSAAICLLYDNRFRKAKTVLQKLSKLDLSGDTPTDHQVKALLAYSLFKTDCFTEASTMANELYKEFNFKLAVSDHPRFCHVNTLLQSLYNEDARENFHKTQAVWQNVYNKRDEILQQDDGQEQLRALAETGREIATQWAEYHDKPFYHKGYVHSCKRVREQAEALKKMTE